MSVGYCMPRSVQPGEPVELRASSPQGAVDVRVVRDGATPAVVWQAASVAVADVEVPLDAPENGCAWPVTVTIPTDESWPSGLYVVQLDDAPPSAWFVVRAARPDATRPLLVLATNTWNAYNEFGGRNLYTGAVTMSFERPLPAGFLAKPAAAGERVVAGNDYPTYCTANDVSFWHGMAGWAGQERRFATWAERNGIELDYATNADLEQVPDVLHGYRLVLSVGHDEYWSWGMRDAVDAHVARGGHVAFFSGNTCYWQVRLEEHRMVCFKHRYEEDPQHGSDRTTTMWADPMVGRPEAAMTGVSFTRGGYARTFRSVPHGSGGYEVHRPDHWLLAATRLRRGDVLGGDAVVVGYECDGCDLTMVDGLPVATGEGGTPPSFEVVATAPATPFDHDSTPLPLAPGGQYELEFHARRLLGSDAPEDCDRLRHGHAVLGSYTTPAGGVVVTVGCTEWAYGLDDPAVAQVTRNVLALAST